METILTRLQEEFAVWRSSSKKRHSNESLKEQAVKCLSHYTQREVSEAIGVSANTLRSWKKSFYCNEEATDSMPSKFVAINLNHEQMTSETNQALSVLQITLPSGIIIKTESTSIASSVALIVSLNKESSPCSI